MGSDAFGGAWGVERLARDHRRIRLGPIWVSCFRLLSPMTGRFDFKGSQWMQTGPTGTSIGRVAFVRLWRRTALSVTVIDRPYRHMTNDDLCDDEDDW